MAEVVQGKGFDFRSGGERVPIVKESRASNALSASPHSLSAALR